MPVYDISKNVPQFNPNMFKKHATKRDYPRMMVDTSGAVPKPYKNAVGKEVVVKSKEEEDAFLASLKPRKAAEPEKAAPVTAVAIDDVTEETVVAAPEKRRGRPPKLPQALED